MYCSTCGKQLEDSTTECANCDGRAAADGGVPNVKYFWVPLILIALLLLIAVVEAIKLPRLILLAATVSSLDEFIWITSDAISIMAAVVGGWAAIRLFKRKQACLKELKLALILGYVAVGWAVVVAVITDDADLVPGMIRFLVLITVCFFYFKRSKTVLKIFGKNME